EADAQHLVVVDQHETDHANTSRTVVPASRLLRTISRPPSKRARSRMLCRPSPLRLPRLAGSNPRPLSLIASDQYLSPRPACTATFVACAWRATLDNASRATYKTMAA